MWLYIWIAYTVMGLYTWYRLLGSIAYERMDDGRYAALSPWEFLGFGTMALLLALVWPGVFVGRWIIRINKYIAENDSDFGSVARAITINGWDIKTKQQKTKDAERELKMLRSQVKDAS